MTDAEKEILIERITALDEEEKNVVIKTLPTVEMLIEVMLRTLDQESKESLMKKVWNV